MAMAISLHSDPLLEKALNVFRAYPEIIASYLFGSRADGTAVTSSDYDFGVLCKKGTSPEREGQLVLELTGKLLSVLQQNHVDVILLRTCRNTELQYAVIQDGIKLFEHDRDGSVTEFEIHTRHEYEDHMHNMRKFGFVKAQ